MSKMLTIITILFLIGSAVSDISPVVQTAYGKVRGIVMKSHNNSDFYVFRGIPYAAPPVNELRFQPPQPPKPWQGIVDSENINKKCIQGVSIFYGGESEDCLYLNIYTPQIPNENKNESLPVLLFIHGGAFVMGSDSIEDFKPYKIMDHDIVMVTIQYRLGFFGFLSTGDLECPGNNGFKDQQWAIRWVKANIRNFGGDPDKITIVGHSAGSASVGYHLLGSNSKGLFRGVIQISGTPLGTWSLQRNPRGYAYQVANQIDPSINENNTSTKELIKWFRRVPVYAIKRACTALFGEENLDSFLNTFVGYVFSGVIEPEHDGAFLSEPAFGKFKSGNYNIVPNLIGITSEEALSYVAGDDFQERVVQYDAAPELIVSPDMHIADDVVKRKVGEEIRRFYVGDDLLQNNRGLSIRLMSDGAFGRPSIKQAQLESQFTNVYFYEFAYSGQLGVRQRKLGNYIPDAESIGHSDDIEYLFPPERRELEMYSEQDILTADRHILLFTNFVKYLNPTPEPSELLQNVIWPSVTPNSFPYLVINETLEVKYDLKKPMVDEYERIYSQYAVPPLDTY